MSDAATAESVLANSVGNFAELIAAGTPAPGGGSVAAYCGVLAGALGQMVCSLSIGKKKYADAEPRLLDVRAELEQLDARLRELIEEDAASFEDVLRAYRLPKDTNEQSVAREDAIQFGASTRGCGAARDSFSKHGGFEASARNRRDRQH
jgi:formiminotetrahydrofolate cyclodeaminase